jgi:hypothetical protein
MYTEKGQVHEDDTQWVRRRLVTVSLASMAYLPHCTILKKSTAIQSKFLNPEQ